MALGDILERPKPAAQLVVWKATEYGEPWRYDREADVATFALDQRPQAAQLAGLLLLDPSVVRVGIRQDG